MKQLYGYDAQEAVGQVSHDLLAAKFPERLPNIVRTLHDTGHWQGELVHRRQDGSSIVVASHWALNDPAMGVSTVIEVNNDITLLKEPKRLFATVRYLSVWRLMLQDSAAGGPTSLKGMIRSWFGTNVTGPLLACQPDSWPITQPGVSRVHPADRPDARKLLERALDPNNPNDDYAVDYRAIRPDGRIVHVSSWPTTPRGYRNHPGRHKNPECGATGAPACRSAAANHCRYRAGPDLRQRQERSLAGANQQVLNLIGKPWDQVKGRT
jgi:PAS domain S-box-containing protein